MEININTCDVIMFDNYNILNTQNISRMGQSNKPTAKDAEIIREIIGRGYNEEKQELILCNSDVTQCGINKIGGRCWSFGTGLHCGLSTWVMQ